MIELDYGEVIEVGDKVKIDKVFVEVYRTERNFCFIRLNKKCVVQLPRVYSRGFKTTCEDDSPTYEVYKDNLGVV